MNTELDDLAGLAREQGSELSVSDSSPPCLALYMGAMNSNPGHHPSFTPNPIKLNVLEYNHTQEKLLVFPDIFLKTF